MIRGGQVIDGGVVDAPATIDIVRTAVANGDITAPDAFGLMTRMADADRALRLPKSPEELVFGTAGRVLSRPGAR